jgi:dimeric dUTPase (all-alpha-NTP-PPase superfamily)
MLDMQQALQTGYSDGDPWTIQSNEHRIAFIQQQYVNITKEIGEALDEVGWKPWGTSRHINAELGLKELVDTFHFFMNWLMTLGPLLGFKDNKELAEAFVEAYLEKNLVNNHRQTMNYNGFADKCPKCGREREVADWREEELRSHGSEDPITLIEFWVCPCGHIYNDSEETTVDG